MYAVRSKYVPQRTHLSFQRRIHDVRVENVQYNDCLLRNVSSCSMRWACTMRSEYVCDRKWIYAVEGEFMRREREKMRHKRQLFVMEGDLFFFLWKPNLYSIRRLWGANMRDIGGENESSKESNCVVGGRCVSWQANIWCRRQIYVVKDKFLS